MIKKIIFLLAFVASLSVVSGDTCEDVADVDKKDCGYVGINEQQCISSNCCWNPAGEDSTTPWCFKKVGVSSYSVKDMKRTSFGYTGMLNLVSDDTGYGTALTQLKLEVVYESASTFRVRINDANNARYEIPQAVISRQKVEDVPPLEESELAYEFTYSASPFTFKVVRKADGAVLFDLQPNLVYKDQMIQLTTAFPSDGSVATYGLGESTRMEQAIQPGTVKTLWAVDTAAADFYTNLYGSFPYYLQLSEGKAHGAMLMNSNGMDVLVNPGSLTFRTIGGIIDLYVFSGDSPDMVVQQYTAVVGKPMMQPYWSLGFHNCKYGYTGLEQVEGVVQGYQNASIPLDIQWMDIDYMQEYRDWTWSSGNFDQAQVAKFVDGLHAQGMHFVPIVDPGIMVYPDYPAYQQGLKEGLFVQDLTNETPYLGQVWPGPVNFPDFLNPGAQAYWTQSIKDFWGGVQVDGLWIDMNEVSNFCNDDGTGQVCVNNDPDNCPTGDINTQTTCCLTCSEVDSTNQLEYPPYRIHNQKGNGNLGVKTMSPSALHYGNVTEYNVHNLYGLTEQIATNNALTDIRGERPFLLTRSSFLSSGKHTAKWTGDNKSTWDDLKSSIVSIMDFNLFGIPMVGADICGFLDNTTEELCARWIEVGAFYPFSRNHNSLGSADQELYLWESVTAAAQNALGIRYKLLPFLYTLMYNAHNMGTTMARSLWYNFPGDAQAADVNYQFMLGSAVLISPVVTEGAVSVDAYFPQGQYWYDFASLALDVDTTKAGVTKTIDTPLTSVNVHVRGGSVVPMQQGGMTTTAASKTPFTLVAALCPDHGAFGSLFVDDGTQTSLEQYLTMEYHVKAGSNTLTASVAANTGYTAASSLSVEVVKIAGLSTVSSVTLDGKAMDPSSWSFDQAAHVLTVTVPGVMVSDAFSLSWH